MVVNMDELSSGRGLGWKSSRAYTAQADHGTGVNDTLDMSCLSRYLNLTIGSRSVWNRVREREREKKRKQEREKDRESEKLRV